LKEAAPKLGEDLLAPKMLGKISCSRAGARMVEKEVVM